MHEMRVVNAGNVVHVDVHLETVSDRLELDDRHLESIDSIVFSPFCSVSLLYSTAPLHSAET